MIHIVIGTKAQLIKMAPVMKELADRNISYNFIFTGQHRETIDELINVFKLKKPDFRLYEGKDITSIPAMILWIIYCLVKTFKNKSQIFKGGKNDVILTHGDAFSALLGALIAKIAGIKAGYVEAGLRSFNYFHPFPEEIVRMLTSHLVNYHFCPGDFAFNNSQKYKGIKINTKENTLLDALRLAIGDKEKKAELPDEKYGLVSIHRFENVFNKKRFAMILDFLEGISQKIKLLFVLHLVTKNKLEEFCFMPQLADNKNIILLPRMDFFRFIKFSNYAEFIVTDGGSNQEEDFYLGKPCLIMRKTTERKEGLGKNAVISDYNKKIIDDFVANYPRLKRNPVSFNISPSKIIVDYLVAFEI